MYSKHHHTRAEQRRQGAATVEFALVFPLLALVFFVSADFCRAFYYSQMITEAARKGAEYAGNADLADLVSYNSTEEAALADMLSVQPKPTVTTEYITSASAIPSVKVTVSYLFKPICTHFQLAKPMLLKRSAEMRLHPSSELPPT